MKGSRICGSCIGVLMALLPSACGSSAASDRTVSESKTEGIPSTSLARAVDPILAAEFVAELPFLTVVDLAFPGDLATQLHESDAVVIGTITGVHLGEETVSSRDQVVCESDEGVPAPGECFSEARSVGLVWMIQVEEAYRKVTASEIASASTVSIEVPLMTLSTPVDVSRARAKALLASGEAVLDGQRVAMLLTAHPTGISLTDITSLAVVATDQSLVPAPFYRDQRNVGIGEVTSIDDLREKLDADGEYRRA